MNKHTWYVYHCPNCGKTESLIRLKTCPLCGAVLKYLFRDWKDELK